MDVVVKMKSTVPDSSVTTEHSSPFPVAVAALPVAWPTIGAAAISGYKLVHLIIFSCRYVVTLCSGKVEGQRLLNRPQEPVFEQLAVIEERNLSIAGSYYVKSIIVFHVMEAKAYKTKI